MTARHVVALSLMAALATGFARPAVGADEDVAWPPERAVRAIREAAPDKPLVAPAKPRKVLVYGRVRTHPESVRCCFCAMEVLGEKTGAFQATASGDPEVFSPESLKQFDAVVMNNTHERSPMLPSGFDQLSEDEKRAAQAREEVLKKSLLDYVAGGGGIVGIHGAVAGVRWPEAMEMLGGAYGGHFAGSVWVKPEEPAHPLCARLEGRSFQVHDEVYLFKVPYSRQKQRVLLAIDLEKTEDPGKRDDNDYAVSWVRRYGRGRVFYCSLGHTTAAYSSPQVLAHYLAGIQFAVGDLKADTAPR